MSDIFNVVSCLKKIKTKNLGQNKDNLINYLSKDYGYNKESANKVIEKAAKENLIRIVLFNGKNSYRIVENGENTMIVPETQLNDTQLNDVDTREAISQERNALTIEETVVGTPAHMLNDEIISTLGKKFETFSESIESRLLNIEEQIIDARDRRIEKKGDDNSDNAFCLNLLKNRISELERQIIEKDAVINFLSNQLVNKNLSGNCSVNKTVNDHNNSFQERVDNIVNNNLPLIQHNNYNKKEKSNVIIIGDSMLNNINSCGLSKSNKVSVSNFPGATSEDILDEIEDTLKTHPDTLIVHTGTNDLTKNINTLRSVKKLCEKAKRISPDTKIAFLNTIYRKDRRNTDKQRVDIDARLKNLFYQKSIPLIDNGNIKEEHVGVKTLHLNRRDNSLFAKNLLGFTEQNLKLFM